MEERFDLLLTKYVLTEMSDNKETSQVISGLLRLLGEQFGVYHIAIVEKSKDKDSYVITYEYCGEDCPEKKNQQVYFKQEGWDEELSRLRAEEVVYFQHADATANIQRDLGLCSGGSFCAALLKHRSEENAVLLIQYREQHHVYSEHEKEAFALAKEMLDVYLLTVRDYAHDREELEKIRTFDTVTGLLKYENFVEVADRLMKEIRPDEQLAVVYTDIANFKYINEHYGYSAGDDVLRHFEQFFTKNCKLPVIACRMFSDNFILLIRMNSDVSEERIIYSTELFSRRFSNEIRVVYPEAKVNLIAGISIVHDVTAGIMQYIDEANIARKKCKKAMGSRCMLYDEEMAAQDRREMQLGIQAEEALLNGEFYFELQPKIDLVTKKAIGAEALVRWKKADGTKAYPDQFIPVFEKTGFITRLDFMVYREVCHYLRKKLRAGQHIVPISVNVSRLHFDNPDFVEQLVQLVDSYEVPHEYLEFEITENVFISEMDKARKAIDELRQAGFLVSMDDFGSGYSSLNLLKELDFDVLKLDKEFLMHGTLDRKDAVIISNIIHMAKQMNIKVLCEGVETEEQVDFLYGADCDLVQGYLYGKPMLVEEFEDLL